jgi:hypothetical protein
MVHFCGCARDVLFFTDGKPWKMARTSHGDTMVIMALQGQKCSMCCKQMESTIHSLAHFMGMMLWCYKSLQCLPCYLFFLLTMTLFSH